MGYDVEHFVGEVTLDLLCRVCSKVLQEPFKCQACNALACSGCWQVSGRDDVKNAEDMKTTCPLCLGVGVDTVGSNDPIVAEAVEKIGSLTVYCPQKNNGCCSTLALADVRDHVVSHCQFTQLVCPHEGCPTSLNRAMYEEHVTTGCEYRIVACAACGAQVAQRDLCVHQQQNACFYQLQRRRLVQAQKDVARDLREHRMAVQRARHSTEQDERRVMKEHFQRQQRQLRRSVHAKLVSVRDLVGNRQMNQIYGLDSQNIV